MKRIAALILLAGLCHSAAAFDPFVASDIRIDGLERIAPGTVFSYLPIEKGDRVDRQRAAAAIRALYKTGFFKDISIDRQGDILVVKVAERPSIAKITITGNKDIKEEDLRKGLREVGLSEGDTYDRLAIDRLQQELTRQYNNRGKYNVAIRVDLTELDRNRVELTIVMSEGKASRIRDINIVGNAKFKEKDVREDFESNTTNWLSWYSRDDQYSREKLTGDLEKLSQFYQDRGYLDYSLESAQVAISPDKRDIYLTANIKEGEQYTIGEIKLTGDLILAEEELRRLIFVKPGETYSLKKLELSSEAMSKVLSNVGYAFADVTPIPQVDKDKRIVALNFFVNPGKRVYVHRILFDGNSRTQDEVIRREMRQLEGSWYSQAAIDRSKIRLQRLGFFKSVDIQTPKVEGTDDQINVIVKVEEETAGAFQFGVGYSQLQGLLTSVSVTERNFLGSGNQIGFTVQNNAITKSYNFNYYDPYFTDDGFSLGYNLSYRKVDQGEANIANFSFDTASGSVNVGVPLTEIDTIQFSTGLSRDKITTIDASTPQSLINQLVNELGDRGRFPCLDDTTMDTDPNTCQNNGPYRQWSVNSWTLGAFFARDSRNKFFAPTRGSYARVGAEVALPGSAFEYYKLSFNGAQYFPVADWLTLLARLDLGYGDGYGKTRDLPFYENFYAGGPQSVRGYRDNTLGPCETVALSSYCQPLGGSFKAAGGFEAIFPTPFVKRNDDSTQISAFLDFGNVYRSVGDFSFREMRGSVGLSMKWRAPVGPIQISIAEPINKDRNDRTESLQFTFGGAF